MDRGRDHGETGPDEHHEREEGAGADVVQGQVRGDLPQDVADGEACVDLIVLVADKA